MARARRRVIGGRVVGRRIVGRRVVKRLGTVRKISNSTRLAQLGISPQNLRGLSPRVKSLTRGDLVRLTEKPYIAPAALNLTFKDLQGLHTLAAKEMKVGTGGGGQGNGPRCCCCIACCCCCCG